MRRTSAGLWLLILAALLVMPSTIRAQTCALPGEDTCDEAGLTGAAWGLCNAYCEAMKCDSEEPAASQIACDRVLQNFQAQTDPNSVPPCIEADTDGDGVCDSADNCVTVPNAPEPGAPQADSDGDGIGDACDCPCWTESDLAFEFAGVVPEHCVDGANGTALWSLTDGITPPLATVGYSASECFYNFGDGRVSVQGLSGTDLAACSATLIYSDGWELCKNPPAAP